MMSWDLVQEAHKMLRGIYGDAFPPPFSPRPINELYLQANGQQIPQIVAEFLSQLDTPRLRCSSPAHTGVHIWETVMDIDALNASGRMVYDLEKIYLKPVREAGAAVIDLPAGVRLIMYPVSIPAIRELFFEAGFGVDDYINPIDGAPLARNLNSPARMRERLDGALVIFDEITAEHPMTVTSIKTTSVKLETIGGPPPREWADRWAKRMWDYYLQNKSEATFAPGFIPGDSLTQKTYVHLARKFGNFMIGGY